MSMDVEGLQELLSNFFSKDGEIEHTVPTCDTCLQEDKCELPTCDTCLQEDKCELDEKTYDKYDQSKCKNFIPKDWRAHISIAGDWWS